LAAIDTWTVNDDNQIMKKYKSEIFGHLDIIVTENEDELEGEKMKWKEVLIHGDPEGLKSFARLLIKLADTNQDDIDGLPIGAREHVHLRPKFDLSKKFRRSNCGTTGRKRDRSLL
jgi:hypothetical protein